MGVSLEPPSLGDTRTPRVDAPWAFLLPLRLPLVSCIQAPAEASSCLIIGVRSVWVVDDRCWGRGEMVEGSLQRPGLGASLGPGFALGAPSGCSRAGQGRAVGSGSAGDRDAHPARGGPPNGAA